jgi:hypothetical protein
LLQKTNRKQNRAFTLYLECGAADVDVLVARSLLEETERDAASAAGGADVGLAPALGHPPAVPQDRDGFGVLDHVKLGRRPLSLLRPRAAQKSTKSFKKHTCKQNEVGEQIRYTGQAGWMDNEIDIVFGTSAAG